MVGVDPVVRLQTPSHHRRLCLSLRPFEWEEVSSGLKICCDLEGLWPLLESSLASVSSFEENDGKKRQRLVRRFKGGFFTAIDSHLLFVEHSKGVLFLSLSRSRFSSSSFASASLSSCWSSSSSPDEESGWVSLQSPLLDLPLCLLCVDERGLLRREEGVFEVECWFSSWRMEHLNRQSLCRGSGSYPASELVTEAC